MSYQDLGNVIALPLKKVWSQAPKKNAELKTPILSQKTSRQLVCHSQMSCESTQRICTSSNLQLNLTKPAMRIVVPSVQDRRLHKVARKNIKINVSPCQPLVLRKQSATGRLPLAPIMENDPVLQEDHREQTNECTDFSPEYTFEGSYRLPKKQPTNQQSLDNMPSLCGLKRSRE